MEVRDIIPNRIGVGVSSWMRNCNRPPQNVAPISEEPSAVLVSLLETCPLGYRFLWATSRTNAFTHLSMPTRDPGTLPFTSLTRIEKATGARASSSNT